MSRIHFVVYDQRTGAIVRSGLCTEDTLSAQAMGANEAVMPSPEFKDPDRHRVAKSGKKMRIVPATNMARMPDRGTVKGK